MSDLIILLLAALLVLLLLLRARLERWGRALAGRTGWSMLLLALLPVVLRLAMLPRSPIPVANGSDDFAHLLVADTLRYFRLANPVHPMHRFFETIFVLQEPTYSSIFPIGQGITLALGRLIFGHSWAGVVASVALLCALTYWMLLAWTTPDWALVGGLLTVIQFGPLRYWMNTYWGGAISAVAGCLVFGSLPRLRERARTRDAVLLGLGIGIQMLTRPFECVLLAGAVALFFAPSLSRARKQAVRLALVTFLAMAPALGLTLLQNKQVTGSWITLPYILSRYQYGVPTTFTTQANPEPHRELTRNQQLDYDAQSLVHGDSPDNFKSYLSRLADRIRYYRFFFLAPLYLVLPFFLPSLRDWRFIYVAITLLIFALGTNFYPYFYPHYIAAVTCLFVLVSVTGLERLSRISPPASAVILIICAVQFLFWYTAHLLPNPPLLESNAWDYVNHGDPMGRIAVRDRLAQSPGKQLVFVRYSPRHMFEEWVANEADIDRARIVWALDRGPDNDNLLRYYPDREAWLLEPDARPRTLTPIDAK